jgi:AraC family transcriptional regulator of adaptative response / DNA-3-methyladenine glycosylase II
VTLRLAYRPPLDAASLWSFLSARAVAGIEDASLGAYRRSLLLAHGTGIATLVPADGHVLCTLRLDDLRDLASAVQRCRRLLDLDADPEAVDATLGNDPALAGGYRPGARLPGAVDGTEIAVRAVVGQQISVAAARTVLARLVGDHGTELSTPDGRVTHAFPTAEALAKADPATLPMPASRKRTIQGLCMAIAAGDVVIEPGVDPADAEAALLALPGIGPWTASYISMRALSLPDLFLATDLGVQRGAAALGLPHDPAGLASYAERWRPWRSYAVLHLWKSA